MSTANPNPMAKLMVSVLVVANAGGRLPLPFQGNSHEETFKDGLKLGIKDLYHVTHGDNHSDGMG
jgi:hypothetical protein